MTTLWINVVTLVFLLSLTGAIMVMLWYAIGLVLERIGFANIVFELLKMVVLFFVLPIAFITLKWYESDMGKGYLFSPTPYIVKLCKPVLPCWLLGAIIVLLTMIFELLWTKVKYREAFPCSGNVQAVFGELKGDLLSKRSVLQLKQCYKASTPCVVGLFQTTIILPVENYTTEELHVILYHEMTHYKQKDLLLKLVAYIVLAIHWFNPFAWILFFKIQKWSEFACDLKACKYVGGPKPYFDVILRITMDNPISNSLVSHMADQKHELIERARKLMKITQMKKRSAFSMILVLCSAFMLSSTSVYAATVECADAYIAMEKATSVEASQTQSVVLSEGMTMEYGDTPGITVVEGESQQHQSRASYGFSWDVPAGYRVYTPWFDCEAGGEILVSAFVDPTNVNMRIGLEDSMGYRYYVEGTDTIAHVFSISSSGEYRIYAQNNTSTDASVDGTYIIR